MKKLFMQVIILYCIMLGGCLGLGGEDSQKMENWLEPSPTVYVEMSTPAPTESVEEAFPVPTMPREEQTPLPTLAVEITVTVVPEKFDLADLGVTPRYNESGEAVYEASTCFYDENGLLCVALKAIYQEETETCIVEKSYYLPNGMLYREAETLQVAETLRVFDGRIVEESHTTKAYEPLVYKTVSGCIWTKNGSMVKASELLGEEYGAKFVCTDKEDYVPVTAGEKIRMDFYFSWFPDVAGIVFLDGNDRLVMSYSFNATTEVKDQYLKVPEGAEKMHLTLFANQNYYLEREVTLIGADLTAIMEEEYLTQAEETLSAGEKRSVKQYDLKKAYVTFVLDDCRPDMNQVADIFSRNDVPLCIAAIQEILPFAVSDGTETRREVCERVVADGGEVLAHDGEIITKERLTDYNDLVKHFYEDKWILEQLGFEINGIMLAGGTGQVVGHEITDLWARAHYRYSDLYGEIKYGEPYYHRRFWLGNCLDSYEQVISDAIEEKEWVVFYLHDLKEVSSTKLQEILQYITSLPENQIEVVTYKELYNKMWE